ncbi:hypothetical protein MMC21_004300 [Puttea exsequens]|nr:hypothetical protein [Puttea exsequens]
METTVLTAAPVNVTGVLLGTGPEPVPTAVSAVTPDGLAVPELTGNGADDAMGVEVASVAAVVVASAAVEAGAAAVDDAGAALAAQAQTALAEAWTWRA